MKNKKKRQAFTLVELIIVIAILGILAAIAIPKYNKSRIKAAETAHRTNVEMLKSAAMMKSLDTDDGFTWTKAEHDGDTYIDKWPEIPNGLTLTDDSGNEYTDYEVKYTKGDANKENDTLIVTPDENAKIK